MIDSGHRFSYLCMTICLALCIRSVEVSGAAYKMPHHSPRIAILGSVRPESAVVNAETIAAKLQKAGLEVTVLELEQFLHPAYFSSEQYDWLILTDSPYFPHSAKETLIPYLHAGGNLILLGGQPFQHITLQTDSGWMTRDELLQQMKEQRNIILPETVLFDFDDGDLSAWSHSSNQSQSETRLVLDEGDAGKSMRMDIRNITGWDVHLATLQQPLKPETNYLSFWAKGDERTPQLLIDLFEKDGSRWNAVVNLTPNWQQYRIPQEDFQARQIVNKQERTEEDDHRKLENLERIAFGLAVNLTRNTSGDHTLWIDDIRAGVMEHLEPLSPFPLDEIDLFNDYVPVPLSEMGEISVAPGQDFLKGIRPMTGNYQGFEIIGFTYPGRTRFMPLLITGDRGKTHEFCLAGMQIHYDDAFRGSTWIAFGLTSPSYYADSAFASTLIRLLSHLDSDQVQAWAKSENEERKTFRSQYPPFNYGLSSQTFGIKYQFTKNDRLVETAQAIADLGSNVLKCHLGDSSFAQYRLPENPEIQSLRDLVEKEPSYQKILAMPFDYYLFWAYPFSENHGNDWRTGLSDDQSQQEYKQFYDLTCYLLERFTDSNKTFLLGHWEGDWSLLGHYDMHKDPTPEAIQGMIDWLNIRQKAIEDARRDIPHQGVEVYQYTEVNLVLKAMEGKPAVVNAVLPHTRVDYVSYSSYETTWYEEDLKKMSERISSVLDYIESQLPPKDIEGRRVFIGEYGYPIAPWEQERSARMAASIALRWGCPFVLYWQIYCNEGQEGGRNHSGFWMIDNHGKKQPIYITFHRFLQHFQEEVDTYRRKHGKNPPTAKFQKDVADWLKYYQGLPTDSLPEND